MLDEYDPLSLDQIKALSPFHLSDLADCMSPDNRESPGARLLERVRNAFVERAEDSTVDFDEDLVMEMATALADDAPNIYTHQRWQEFLDLGAYQEEPEHSDWPDDLTNAAGVALYQIAERLVNRLGMSYIRWQEETRYDLENGDV